MSGEGDEFALPVIFGKSNCPEFSRLELTSTRLFHENRYAHKTLNHRFSLFIYSDHRKSNIPTTGTTGNTIFQPPKAQYFNHRKSNIPTTGNAIIQTPEVQYSEHWKYNVPTTGNTIYHRKHNIPTNGNTIHVFREAFTAVAHHNKTPDFYEEVKIKLPSNLRLVLTRDIIKTNKSSTLK